jgi:hypothetical protein
MNDLISLEKTRTTFVRTDVRDCPDLAESMTVRQRMSSVLRHGAVEPKTLADEIGAKTETVTRIARKYKAQFIVIEGGSLLCTQRKIAIEVLGPSIRTGVRTVRTDTPYL